MLGKGKGKKTNELNLHTMSEPSKAGITESEKVYLLTTFFLNIFIAPMDNPPPSNHQSSQIPPKPLNILHANEGINPPTSTPCKESQYAGEGNNLLRLH